MKTGAPLRKFGFIFFFWSFVAILILFIRTAHSRYSPGISFSPTPQNKWFEVVIPSRSVPPLTSVFRYPDLILHPPRVLNRSQYSIELVRYLGLDPSDPDLSAERVLVIGSGTVIGTAVERNLRDSGQRFVCVRSPLGFDLSYSDAWIALQHLSIKRAIVVHQPFLFRHSESDGGGYIERINARYVEGVAAMLGGRGIATTFVVTPPHFAIFERFVGTAQVVLLPHVIDGAQNVDTENIVSRAIGECHRRNQTEIESFDAELISNVDVDRAIAWILADHRIGLYRINGNDSIHVEQVQLVGCSISARKSPHRSVTLSGQASNITIASALMANELLSQTSGRIANVNSVYLSIVVTGRNDNYGAGFLKRAQNFLNKLGESLALVPLAELEIVCVDYAAPPGQKNLHEIFELPEALRGRVRFVIVPSRFHEEFHAPVGFLEYVAKNIGIYRSRGEFVAAMNPDSLLSYHFLENCANRAFNPGVFYVSHRVMMQENEQETTEFQKINEPWRYPNPEPLASFRLLSGDKDTFGYDYVPGLGDFTMMSKALWDAIGAYHILSSNTYVDHILKGKMLKIVSGGYTAKLPFPVLHQYHPHVSSNRPSESMAFVNTTLDDYLQYGRLVHVDYEVDRPTWGFPDGNFREVRF
jgi:hypothetical protein